MVGYLKRGQAYRRRGELAAAIRDLRRASEIDPSATRPLEELGDAYLADTPHRYGSAAERFEAYVKLDDRARSASSTSWRSRATTTASPPRRSTRSSGRSRSTTGSPRPTTCSACASATRSIPTRRAWRSRSRSSCSPALLHAREELADLYGALGRTDDRLTQLEALSRLDPGASREVALGLAYARAGQHGSRRHDARARRRALSRLPLRLRRARPRLARDRAGAQRSRSR